MLTTPGGLHESGSDIRTIQDLLDHKDVSKAMINTDVLHNGGHEQLAGVCRLYGPDAIEMNKVRSSW